jgi:hypothetical protein
MPHKQIGVAQHAAEMLSDAGVQSVRSVARLDRWKSTEIIKPYYRTDTVNEREALMKIDPETFYITNHYLNYPAMLVRLSTVQPDDLRKLITESWQRSAPAKLVAAYDKRP